MHARMRVIQAKKQSSKTIPIIPQHTHTHTHFHTKPSQVRISMDSKSGHIM